MKCAGVETIHSGQLYAEQIKLLYKNAPIAYSATLINGLILAYVQSKYFSISVLLGWYGSLLLITVLRAVVAWLYYRVKPGVEQAHYWSVVYVVGAAAAGCVWGTAALVLFPMESAAHQVFVAFVLAGMAAGGISVLAPRMEACVAFLLPELLPLAVRYLTLSTTLDTAMGVMTLIFLGGITLSARNFHRTIRTSLELRFDKQELETEIERRQCAEEQLFQEKDRLQATVSSIGEGVALIDADGRIEYINPAAEVLCGHACHDALHRLPSDVFECYDYQERRMTTALEDSLPSAKPQKKQSVLYGAGRRKYLIEEVATPRIDRHGKLVGAVSVFRDVTDALQLTEQLMYAADHDVLTGLPNRNLLRDRTQHAIAQAQRKREGFALLFLDLDHFKVVNDSMGHAIGDALLADVARRLTRCVREEDTVARLGGDEFVVVLAGPTMQRQVDAITDKLLHALREPFRLGERYVTVTASIGVSIYPDDGHNAESLLLNADSAMYRAKKSGRNRSSRMEMNDVIPNPLGNTRKST